MTYGLAIVLGVALGIGLSALYVLGHLLKLRAEKRALIARTLADFDREPVLGGKLKAA